MNLSPTVLDRIPAGIFLADGGLSVRYWNPCMEDWTGIPAAEIRDRPLDSFFPAFREPGLRIRIRQVFERRTPVVLTYRLHGNLFPNRDPSRLERVYHTTIAYLEAPDPLAIFNLEDRTEVSARIREAREELDRRMEAENRLREALREKDLLFQEIHHRVKNNLNTVASLIRLQMDAVRDEEARSQFRDLESRIESFSALHETLYRSQVYDRVDAAEYLSTVAAQLRSSLGLEGVPFALALDPLKLVTKRALHLGLALAELFTNAVKYGGADEGKLSIALERTAPARARLSVEDRGPGLPEGFDASRADSLGLRLAGILAEQLGGTLSFRAAVPRGTRAELEFDTGESEAPIPASPGNSSPPEDPRSPRG